MEDQCSCGCGTTTMVTEASEPCGCGCSCCADDAMSTEEAIAQLTTMRASIDARLAELEAS